MFNEIVYERVQRVATIFMVSWVVIIFILQSLTMTVEQMDFKSPLSVFIAFIFFKIMLYYSRKDIF